MVMSNKEYLESLQKNAKTSCGKSTGCFSRQNLRNGAIILASSLVVTGLASLFTSFGNSSDYDSFKSGQPVIFKNLNYKDTFSIWNARDNGNDINALLTGGKILVKDGLQISGLSEKDKELGFNYIANASYINKVGNQILYRDNKDRHIYILNLQDNTKKLVYDGNSGQAICVNSKLFFVDFSSGGKLACIDLNSDDYKKTIVIESQVKRFAVCGDTYLYLNTNQELFAGGDNRGNHTKLSGMVERFYLNGDIIVESGDRIIAFTPSGKNARSLYKSSNADMRLAGVCDGKLLVLENNVIHELVNGKLKPLSETNARIIDSAVSKDGYVYAGIYYEQDGNIVPQIIKLSK